MNILIASDWYKPVINGVVTSVDNLRNELIKMGHDVRIATLSSSPKSYYRDGIYYIASVSAEKIYPNARLKSVLSRTAIKKTLKWKPDIIHTQCEFSTFFLARKASKFLDIPIVHTYHTVYEDYTHYFSLNDRLGKSIVKSFTNIMIEKTDAVIVPSIKTYDILMKYGVEKPIYTIPSGINLDMFDIEYAEPELDDLKNKLNIPKDNKVLVYLGRLGKEKNIDQIIDFLDKINNPKYTLLIVGDGPYKGALENYAKNKVTRKNIIFAGMVKPDEVVKYYKLGHVFVNASTSETQGLTYIEALASSLPAICKRDQCLEDVIIDGENGWQYDEFEDFEYHLNLLLSNDDLHKSFKINAKEHAFKKFSARSFAESVLKVYKESIYNNASYREVI